jgi:ubiquitin carboxyl-terminal hydrolase 25
MRLGKTAPRLLQDIFLYDPANPPASERNLLSEVPPVFADDNNGIFEWLSPSACRHSFITKTNQTYLPPEERRQVVGATSRVSAVCATCRYHLQMVVTYTRGAGQYMPEAAGHIHHLVYKSGRQFGRTSRDEIASTNQHIETFHFECSHPQCGTRVSLRWVSPLLSRQWTHILTDPDLLTARTDEAIAANPERLEGIPRPLPINVLDNLRTYIYNALHESSRSKPISAMNKRFITCFGVDGKPCKELLEFLGFSANVCSHCLSAVYWSANCTFLRMMVSGNPHRLTPPLARRFKVKLIFSLTMRCMSFISSSIKDRQRRRKFLMSFHLQPLHALTSRKHSVFRIVSFC